MAPQDVDIGMDDLRNTDSNVPKGPYIANGSVDHIVPNGDHSDDEEMNHETLTLPEVDSNRTDVVQRRKEFRGRHIQMMALGMPPRDGIDGRCCSWNRITIRLRSSFISWRSCIAMVGLLAYWNRGIRCLGIPVRTTNSR
jgi:hypothetical protein